MELDLEIPSPVDEDNNLLLFSSGPIDGPIENDTTWRPVAGPSSRAAVVPRKFAAIDYESYFSSKYSLKNLTLWEYVNHAAFNAYVVSIERFDGRNWWRWVGDPRLAPWLDLVGYDLVSHEARFDELVTRKLIHDKIVPAEILIERWHCTADLASFFQFDRGLAAIAPLLLGETADKSVRERMKHGNAGKSEIKDYVARDSRQCGWIWYLNHQLWPEREQILSRTYRRRGYEGVYVDQPLAIQCIAAMRRVQLAAATRIPWAAKYKPTGVKGLIIECAKRGIPTPPPAAPRPGVKKASTQPGLALDDPGVASWAEKYDKDGWLESVREFTKARQMEANCQMLLDRARRDGTVPFELLYRKAPHTARWQSGGGLRLQNLDKDDFHQFNARWFIRARPDHAFLIADLSQIEPRVLNWLVGDEVFLRACAAGQSPYDAHARSTMDYKDPRSLKKAFPGLYALAKARLLALGYQAGPPKFCEMARTMAMITVFEEESSYSPDLKQFFRGSEIKDRIARGDLDGWSVFPPAVESVADFRQKSPLIAHPRTGIWAKSEAEMRACIGGDCFVPLPDGGVLRYFDVEEEHSGRHRELVAWVVKNSRNPKHRKKLYGGKLTENRVQRVARDVLADIKCRVDRIDPRRLKIRWSVHDEIIAECKRTEAKALFEALLHEMKTPPSWAKGLPVSAEGAEFKDENGKILSIGILDHYVK